MEQTFKYIYIFHKTSYIIPLHLYTFIKACLCLCTERYWRRATIIFFLFFSFSFLKNFMASLQHDSSHSRGWMWAEAKTYTSAAAILDSLNTGFFESLPRARDWIYTSAVTWAATVGFLTHTPLQEFHRNFKQLPLDDLGWFLPSSLYLSKTHGLSIWACIDFIIRKKMIKLFSIWNKSQKNK